MKKAIRPFIAAILGLGSVACSFPFFEQTQEDSDSLRGALPQIEEIDAVVSRVMETEEVPGIALAVIDAGEIRYIKSYGFRDIESGAALNNETVMYGASLTKFVFATFVLELVDEGEIDLDRSIADYLPKPLPEYEDYTDIAGEEHWRELTMRILLGHTTGFSNYRFFPPEGGYDPEGKLKFYYAPGSRYGYSGEGYYVAQLVIEEGLNLDVGEEIQRRIFDRFGMKRTGMTWRDDFAPNISIGYTMEGERRGHNARSNARAAGSMDTTIADIAVWIAAFMRNEGLSAEARAEILKPHIAIRSRRQFPTLDPAVNPRNEEVELAAGLGVVTWQSPSGLGFFKGGHSDTTDNLLVCLENGKRCVVLLSNTAKGDRVFPQIVRSILGDVRLPWAWEYSSLDAGK
jgi:CubicO group peptidase (beta-lactamase class C family)